MWKIRYRHCPWNVITPKSLLLRHVAVLTNPEYCNCCEVGDTALTTIYPWTGSPNAKLCICLQCASCDADTYLPERVEAVEVDC